MLWLLLSACGGADPGPAADPVEPPREVPVPEARAPRTGRQAREGGPLRIEGVHLNPEAPTAADDIRATVDLGGVTGAPPVLDFTWYVDDVVVDGAISDTLRAGKALRGQRVRLEVATVGTTPVIQARSDVLTIANRPPVLLTDPKTFGFIDGHAVKAEDPDGEPLTWRLEGGPAGMSIDPKGILHYAGSADEKGGSYQVKIIAEDTARAYVVLELPLTLTPGSAAVRKAEEEKKAAEDAKSASGDAGKAATTGSSR